jgi:hypothetical protein
MNIPKALQQYATAHGLRIAVITYKYQGIKCNRKGFDLVKPNGQIVASYEPVSFYSSPNKWYVRNVHTNFTGRRYLTRIDNTALNELNPNENSFFTNLQAIK